MTTVKYPHVSVRLVGQNGNAYNIIALVALALKREEGREAEAEWKQAAFAAGSYDGLLQLAMSCVDVQCGTGAWLDYPTTSASWRYANVSRTRGPRRRRRWVAPRPRWRRSKPGRPRTRRKGLSRTEGRGGSLRLRIRTGGDLPGSGWNDRLPAVLRE